jgi:hypothetical protein
MQPPKLPRKRATPEGREASEAETPQHVAAILPQAGQPLQDLTNTQQLPESAAPASPPNPARPADPEAAAALVASPGRNRQLFMAQMTPQHMTCDLTSAVVGLGVKHNLQAIVVACYPIQKGPPARRHVTLRDQHGATGKHTQSQQSELIMKDSRNTLAHHLTVQQESPCGTRT